MMYLIWLLRIIHIGAGVFWVGGSLVMTFFVAPSIGVIGESGQKFIGHLMNNLKFSSRMAAASGSSILAGLILFWLDARAGEAWLRSDFATGLSIGAGFALIGFVAGMLFGRTTRAMAHLGAQIQGKPKPEQQAQMQKFQKRQSAYSIVSTVTILLSVIFMSIARYM
jgi:hypothetical protein